MGKILTFSACRRLKPCEVLILHMYYWLWDHLYFHQIRFNPTYVGFNMYFKKTTFQLNKPVWVISILQEYYLPSNKCAHSICSYQQSDDPSFSLAWSVINVLRGMSKYSCPSFSQLRRTKTVDVSKILSAVGAPSTTRTNLQVFTSFAAPYQHILL